MLAWLAFDALCCMLLLLLLSPSHFRESTSVQSAAYLGGSFIQVAAHISQPYQARPWPSEKCSQAAEQPGRYAMTPLSPGCCCRRRRRTVNSTVTVAVAAPPPPAGAIRLTDRKVSSFAGMVVVGGVTFKSHFLTTTIYLTTSLAFPSSSSTTPTPVKLQSYTPTLARAASRFALRPASLIAATRLAAIPIARPSTPLRTFTTSTPSNMPPLPLKQAEEVGE